MKIGFIDYYLDEWHANNYPQMLKEASGGEMEVAYAYGHITSPLTGMTSQEWCDKYHITLCDTIEELIEKSDALVVLSPDNCEMKEELSRLALMSGKRTYIDKIFAPDKKTAEGMFALGEQYNTPCYSTSALRFAAEYQPHIGKQVTAMSTWGPNKADTYCIHQLEPMMMLMGGSVKRAMALTQGNWVNVLLEWEDGRCGSVLCSGSGATPFMSNIRGESGSTTVQVKSDFFGAFIANLVEFFRTGIIPVSHQETVSIMAAQELIWKAIAAPGCWVAME